MSTLPEKGLQIRTLIKPEGELELSLAEVEIPTPGPTDIIIKVEATPINPSDLGLLVGAGDISTAVQSGTADRPVITAKVPEAGMRAMKARIGESLPVGNEGAGTVVAAGESEAAQALLGKRVTGLGGEFYAEYRMLNVAQVMELPDGISAEQGASCYVNPLTALSFVETMRNMGHESLVHTAAASNLGQMLNKICLKDGVPLVNIVRKEEQAKLLKDQGATHVVNSSDDDFLEQLKAAIDETDAFYGFDPIGGGKMVDTCFKAMEQVAVGKMSEYSRYGSNQQKRMFIYGRLDFGPTTLTPSYGFGWTLSGWLLTPFLQSAGMETVMRMRKRVLDNLGTTFASGYKTKVDLEGMLTKDAILDYRQMKTGEKYLVTPQG